MCADGRMLCVLMGGRVSFQPLRNCVSYMYIHVCNLDREAFQVLILNIRVNGVKMGVRSKLEVFCILVKFDCLPRCISPYYR